MRRPAMSSEHAVVRSFVAVVLFALLLPTGCGDDLQADTMADPDVDDADPAGERDPEDPPPPAPEACERYLACIDALRPAELAAHEHEYGPGGTCWDAGPAEAALCVEACDEALTREHRDHPRVRACMLCRSDDECNSGAGEFCFAGGCEVIEPEFVADDGPPDRQ